MDPKKQNDEVAPMALETERLVLRRWDQRDAEALFRYASDPAVGPQAGWPPHRSAEESLDIIKNVLNGPEAYAITMKEGGEVIGAIELKLNAQTGTPADGECELGFWIARPFWGQGLVPEAAQEILRHAFEDMGSAMVWCRFYDGNAQSQRVQEKLGFTPLRTEHDVDLPRLHTKRTVHVNGMTREEWFSRRRRP